VTSQLLHRQAVLAQPAQQPRVLERDSLGGRQVAVEHQRVDRCDRPCRRERGVAMQPTQRLDSQIAVDQHEPIGVADHHHRHLLPDLGHRAYQPPASFAVVDPQVAVPELELVQVHFHAGQAACATPLPPSRLAPAPHQLRRIVA
jgi:hypothetical protein